MSEDIHKHVAGLKEIRFTVTEDQADRYEMLLDKLFEAERIWDRQEAEASEAVERFCSNDSKRKKSLEELKENTRLAREGNLAGLRLATGRQDHSYLMELTRLHLRVLRDNQEDENDMQMNGAIERCLTILANNSDDKAERVLCWRELAKMYPGNKFHEEKLEEELNSQK